MIDFVSWYFSSLAEFWGSAIRVGLPQILLVILLVCWLRRRRCGKGRRSCCRGWSWGCGPRIRCCEPGCCEKCDCYGGGGSSDQSCCASDTGCAQGSDEAAATAEKGAEGGD